MYQESTTCLEFSLIVEFSTSLLIIYELTTESINNWISISKIIKNRYKKPKEQFDNEISGDGIEFVNHKSLLTQ